MVEVVVATRAGNSDGGAGEFEEGFRGGSFAAVVGNFEEVEVGKARILK